MCVCVCRSTKNSKWLWISVKHLFKVIDRFVIY